MANVTINNISEFRTVAAKYGVEVPAKQGRPPAVKLAQAIVAAGDTITPTDYFTGRTEYAVNQVLANKGKGEWKLTGTRVMLDKNGKERTIPFSKVVTVGEVRAATGREGLKGKLSGEAFAEYLTKLFDGAKVTVKSQERVTAVVSTAPSAPKVEATDLDATPEPSEDNASE